MGPDTFAGVLALRAGILLGTVGLLSCSGSSEPPTDIPCFSTASCQNGQVCIASTCTNPARVGEPCSTYDATCIAGAVCLGLADGTPGEGVCVTRLSEGENCAHERFLACRDGLTCFGPYDDDPDDYRCRAEGTGTTDEPCRETPNCLPSHHCSTFSRTCQPKGMRGDACPCYADLECTDHLHPQWCVESGDRGSSCASTMDCAESQLCTPYWASPGTNICSEADPAGIYTLILRDLGSAIAWQYAIIEVDNEGTVTRARTDVGRPQLDFCFGYVDCNGPSDRCWPVSVSGRITTTGTGGLRARFSWPRTEFGQEVIEAGTVDLQGTDLRAQGVALQYATRRGDCDLNYYSFSRNHEWELFRCECPDPNQVCVPDFGRAQDGTIELRPIRTTCVGLPE